MSGPLVFRRYTNSELEIISFATLKKTYPGKIPLQVDIELVLEKSDDIIIDSMVGFMQEYEVAAALCLNGYNRSKVVIVDRDEFDDNDSVRARFSVAHELGHSKIHEIIFDICQCFTPEESLRISHKIRDEQYKQIEDEADYFARAILMPLENLNRQITEYYHTVASSFHYNSGNVISHVIASIANDFYVSPYEVEKRLKDTNFWDRIKCSCEKESDFLFL